jgi:hypothetical protein
MNLVQVFSELVECVFHPHYATPLIQFAAFFIPDFLKVVNKQLDLISQSEEMPRMMNQGGISTGCYDSDIPGFCPAEFSSCTDCYENWPTNPGYEEPPIGGSPPFDCYRRYLEDMDKCRSLQDRNCSLACAHWLHPSKSALLPANLRKLLKERDSDTIEVPECVDCPELDLDYILCIDRCVKAYSDCVHRADETLRRCQLWGR